MVGWGRLGRGQLVDRDSDWSGGNKDVWSRGAGAGVAERGGVVDQVYYGIGPGDVVQRLDTLRVPDDVGIHILSG